MCTVNGPPKSPRPSGPPQGRQSFIPDAPVLICPCCQEQFLSILNLKEHIYDSECSEILKWARDPTVFERLAQDQMRKLNAMPGNTPVLVKPSKTSAVVASRPRRHITFEENDV